MSEDYDSFYKRMVEKYPREFRNVYCGVSINAGWEHIIENLVAQAHHIKWRRDMRMRDHLQNRAVKRGKLRHGGWVRTLCDKHEAEYQQRIKDRNYE